MKVKLGLMTCFSLPPEPIMHNQLNSHDDCPYKVMEFELPEEETNNSNSPEQSSSSTDIALKTLEILKRLDSKLDTYISISLEIKVYKWLVWSVSRRPIAKCPSLRGIAIRECSPFNLSLIHI